MIDNLKRGFYRGEIMKVLHLLNSNIFSGAERVAINLIKASRPEVEAVYCSPYGSIKDILEKNNIKRAIGIDVDRISNLKVDKQEKRSSLGIPQNAIIVLSVGELSDRKNHSTVLKAVSTLKNYNIYYVVCGIGDNKDKLLSLAKEKNFYGRLKLLGYRTDIVEIMKASDLFVFPSLLEGLPVSLMEAMAAGLPIIASNYKRKYGFN